MPLSPVGLPGGGGQGLWSEAPGLYLCRRGQALRLYDPAAGRVFLTHREAAARRKEAEARRAAEARAAEEAEARQAAEARIAELEALLSAGGVPAPPEKRRP